MSNDKMMQEVLAVIDRYFENAKPDDNYNISLIRNEIKKYGPLLVSLGFAAIAFDVQFAGERTMSMFAYDETAGNKYLIGRGMRLLSFQHSLIKGYGESGVEALLGVLEATDEDAAALAGLTLASREFIRPSSLPKLKSAFQKAYGSGYRLALALAMYQHGDKRVFKELAVQFLLGRLPSEMEDFGLQIAAEKVMGVVLLDIASNGRAYDGHGKASWRKKDYP